MKNQQLVIDLRGISAVIFDMNGTIIDDGAYHNRAFMEFFRRYNIDLSEEEYRRRFYARKNEEVMEEFFGKPLSPQEVQDLAQEKEDIYHDLYRPHIKEIAGFTAFARKLKDRGIKLGLATASGFTNLEFTFQELPIETLFDAVVHAGQVTKAKPHPELYLKTAALLTVEAKKCLVFEDSHVGVAAAQAAGMQVIGVLTGHTAEELGVERATTDFKSIKLRL